MIVILKQQTTTSQLDQLIEWMKSLHFDVHLSKGKLQTIIGLIGDTAQLDMDLIKALDYVEDVRRISEPYKNANRKFHAEDAIFDINGVKIGGGNFQIIAGPCSVESEAQIMTVAKAVQTAGATILRGGAFKPRTSPYAFQGLHGEGLKLLSLAKRETGMPLITEIMDANHIPMFEDVDIIQVGARNMQNFELLKELGKLQKPVMIKRGLANTLQELLMSAEYVMANGNKQVMLCERGIRTFEPATRNTLDISAVPVLRELTHLPILIDPSHSCGVARWVKPLALAATAVGVDGLMIEVHNDPKHALCDGAQSLTPQAFADLAANVRAVYQAVRQQVNNPTDKSSHLAAAACAVC